jgi:hypothetical protein
MFYLKKIQFLDIFDFLINFFKILLILYIIYRVISLQFSFNNFEYK